MSRHCVDTFAALALLSLLAACASSGGSGRDTAAERTRAPIEAASATGPAATDVDPDGSGASNDAGEPEAEPGPVVDLSIEPYLDEIDERTQRRYDSALAAMRAGDFLQAELELEELLAEQPGLPGPYVNLAVIYKRDGRIDEARAALEQAIAIAPEFPPANNELGVMLRENGEFAAAEQAYRRALDADPANSIAHLNIGILLDLYLQRGDEALEHYNEYQASLSEPNETVARWIVDLERRVRSGEQVARD